MKYILTYLACLTVLSAVSIAVPQLCWAECKAVTPQPPCWASGPVAKLCAIPSRPWTGEYEWLIGAQIAATTPGPEVELPCKGVDPMVVRVRVKGGPLFTMKPIYCANPWDTNQSGALTLADTTRQALIVGKGCSLGRKP